VPSLAEGEATASEASVCGLEGDCRQANGRGVFIHRGRSKEVRQWPEARDSRSSWAQVDPEVVAKLDEVRKAKGMTPRAVSDEDRFEVPVLLTSLRPLQLPVPRVGSTRTPSADDWHAADAVEEICERLFFSMINEGFKILEETLCQLCRQVSHRCLRVSASDRKGLWPDPRTSTWPTSTATVSPPPRPEYYAPARWEQKLFSFDVVGWAVHRSVHQNIR